MRTLIVDNYDSFTYNLYHYLAEVNRSEPYVIRNDEPNWSLERLWDFDNVLISPGPGTPVLDRDFGICREIIERADLPVLGVCLGHQGVAYASGAVVGLAPEPRHGRISHVIHNSTGLFTGIPSPFSAVRYHSLAVSDLPEELEVIGRTPDGVLMALRHRHRPLWGVQFHPESICTEYGHELLRNFINLTRQWWHARRSGDGGMSRFRRIGSKHRSDLGSPSHHTYQSKASRPRSVKHWKVMVRKLATRWNEEVVFRELFGSADYSIWLDSSRPDATVGRFSIMGSADGPDAYVVTADVRQHTVTVRGPAGVVTESSGFFDWINRETQVNRCAAPDLPFDFSLGWVGYLGYELKAECGSTAVHQSSVPDAAMIFLDRALVFDHATSTTYLLALDTGRGQVADEWLDAITRKLDELAGSEPAYNDVNISVPEITLRHDRTQYLKLIEKCQTAIRAGETYEVCLTNMADADCRLDPWSSYQSLRRTNPAPFAALLRLDRLSVLSTSPERFLKISNDRLVESKPIKGTRPRGHSTDEDIRLRDDLAASEKDRSENLMITDLVRNDLGRTAKVRSVEVPKLFDVESYATVHQLVSTVRARLRPGLSAIDCIRAAFPGGSMTGAPKIRTMEIIDDLEAGPRGVYSGAIGYLSLTGAADLSITIRTAVLDADRVTYGIGGAIVALSDPVEEYEETAVKARPLLRLLDVDFPGSKIGR